ncbi:RNase adapter RapZ [Halochromatium salexigens]|uniref:RNase adaptor protein RapZ n=1 Tax=Halochromatium salexigens TaxID=49447 RepID=A0AAJ0UI03_HALSE|nr:RNase adapter RapZ [Halochromatium salexigens]MBK5931643.1 RNase adaptor protein RapZ [Halochromatium salexigens]
MELIIVSGLSGAGKSVALRTLEDIGFVCIDNLPLFLLHDLALGLKQTRPEGGDGRGGTAIGIDARSGPDLLEQVPGVVKALEARGISIRVIFLDADTPTLVSRFSETRRKHPLTDAERPLAEAIELERRLLEPLRRTATTQIDTSYTNVHELRELIRENLNRKGRVRAPLLLQSFGFKNGIPAAVDFVFDVRCLPNPHWQPELRPLTGLDPEVAGFLEGSPEAIRMREDLIDFLDRWVPRFENDGRSYLTIGIGCTGGRHRSVFMVNALQRHFEGQGHQVLVRHRELA